MSGRHHGMAQKGGHSGEHRVGPEGAWKERAGCNTESGGVTHAPEMQAGRSEIEGSQARTRLRPAVVGGDTTGALVSETVGVPPEHG